MLSDISHVRNRFSLFYPDLVHQFWSVNKEVVTSVISYNITQPEASSDIANILDANVGLFAAPKLFIVSCDVGCLKELLTQVKRFFTSLNAICANCSYCLPIGCYLQKGLHIATSGPPLMVHGTIHTQFYTGIWTECKFDVRVLHIHEPAVLV